MTETISGSARKAAHAGGPHPQGKQPGAGGGARQAGAPTRGGLKIGRIFTKPGVHPYDEVEWERRDVVMTNWRDGSVNFEQLGVEFPAFWSANAANIVTTKYFRGAQGTDQREWSLKQVVDRVVKTYRKAGEEFGYFAGPEDAEVFEHELTHALVHQVFSFNSPVWFNVGTQSVQQVSACFILAVDDTMDSILNWYREEGLIFKGGSGAGLNLSRIRSSRELLSSGGNASGPVSFMRGADASAGTIKSGGATRRAAKMVVLDVDHPDVREFVWTKAREEDKIRVLRDAGFDMDLGGADITSVQYQNANNSVRVNDAFMQAVEEGKAFDLLARGDNSVIDTIDAKDLFRQMAQAAWECADPGIQYDGTINAWHTNPNTGRISASNPCFPADQKVVTDKGLIPIGDLVRRAADGESFAVYTNDLTSESEPAARIVATSPVRYMVTGTKEILKLRFSDGSELRCTPNHRLWTANRGWVRAEELTDQDRVVRSFHHAARSAASWQLPEVAFEAAAQVRSDGAVVLPEKWDEELAHYLGWLVGDGCLTDSAAVTVYGSETEQTEIMPRHKALLDRLVGYDLKPSLQKNGTYQLRACRAGVRAFFGALGISSGRSPDKRLPRTVFEAPEEALTAFLRGLFDADGCVVNQVVKGTRYVGLGSRSAGMLREVQEVLASLGIASRVYKTGQKTDSFTYERKDGTVVSYSSDSPSYDLRISGRSIRDFAARIGFGHPEKAAKLGALLQNHAFYDKDESVTLSSRESDGFETTYNLTEPRNHSYIVSGVTVANCSEYMSLDNSSCNLASLNLMKFLRDADAAGQETAQETAGAGRPSFDTETFAKMVELVITAMDISISFADFPTEPITKTTRDFRQLGIGYANLGALLMATGHAYDSDGGRAIAAAVTALMSGTAYKRSAELAAVVGPYAGYAANAEPHTAVMRKHAAATDAIEALEPFDAEIKTAAQAAWTAGIETGLRNGWRNAQASLLAPTGTIGFMMDVDTTGIEPDLALVKFKKLVGGGSMQIVNNTVPRALRKLGYHEEQIEAVVEYIAEHGHVVDAPGLKRSHYEVFDCAMGDRSIAPMGHVKMMAAVQPHLSGAISKTVNMPESATVEEIEEIYFQGWKLGLKALAIYRNNCKVGQPLQDAKGAKRAAAAEAKAAEAGTAVAAAATAAPAREVVVEYKPVRKRLPKNRPGSTTSFSVGGAEGYMISNSYPDDGLGELFLKMSKQGSTLAGMMDAFSIAISVGLQYGVPLETFVAKFTNMRFEPAGLTDDPDVRMAQSILDYIFRRLALNHLPFDVRADYGIYSATERQRQVETGSYLPLDDDADLTEIAQSAPIEDRVPKSGPSKDGGGRAATADRGRASDDPARSTSAAPQAAVPTRAGSSMEVLEAKVGHAADAPLCMTCGTKMRPAGSCYACEGCGSTSGCS
ncbi:MAG TPA: vitamin B12-dependent ribonucleotide reductase [Actinocrinis sp.]|jgi:ribonucleoside-diphosphate reductase alpha chain